MIQSFSEDQYEALPSQVNGIRVFKHRDKELGHQKIVNFQCPNCGGQQAYSTKQGTLICTFCQHESGPHLPEAQIRAFHSGPSVTQKHEFKLDTLEEASQSWAPGEIDLDCQQCGAHFTLPPQRLSARCPFCQSPQVIQQRRRDDALSPQALIPFQVTPEAFAGPAQAWLGEHWLVPKDLANSVTASAFEPTYVPYWSFDAHTLAQWKAEVGYTKTESYWEDGERKTRTVTVWRWENGQVKKNFQNLLVSGSQHLDDRLLGKVDHFDLAGLQAYQAGFLAGIPAQAYEVPLESAWQSGRRRIRERVKELCLQQPGSKQVRNFSMELDLQEEQWKYLLLPFLISGYQYEGESYQIIANGQTSKLNGFRPADWFKVKLLSVFAFFPALICLALGFLLPQAEPQPWIFGSIALAVLAGVGIYFLYQTAQRLEG